MAAIFRPSANLIAKLGLAGCAVMLFSIVLLLWFGPRSDYARNVGLTFLQPAPFSHQHHVSGLGLDCRFCHTSVEASSSAGMPPTYTCMTCHSQVWTNAAMLAPVRESLAKNKPLAWRRVTDLPDYVYFNHSIHIAKGVGCSSCHGDVAQMPLTFKAKSLTMKFCLDCHRDPGPKLRPKDKIYDTHWREADETRSSDALLAEYRIGGRKLTDCSICHR
ncbi:cytochrome c3 family protein [Methylocystis sp. IM2]|uniref:cytochrome c3 family protein n=2 Tax=Methylocystis TaxID=133 RepID=UPI0030F5A10F